MEAAGAAAWRARHRSEAEAHAWRPLAAQARARAPKRERAHLTPGADYRSLYRHTEWLLGEAARGGNASALGPGVREAARRVAALRESAQRRRHHSR